MTRYPYQATNAIKRRKRIENDPQDDSGKKSYAPDPKPVSKKKGKRK